MPPTSEATTGRDSFEDAQALGLAMGRQDGDVEGSGDRGNIVAATGEDDPMGDTVGLRSLLELIAPAALADDEQVGIRDIAKDERPGIEERLVALLGLESRDDAHDLRTGLHPILIAERAARLLVVVSIEIDAVVDEPDRRPVAMLARDLVLDGIRDSDELIHLRGKRPQRLAVLRRTNPGRVDGRHNIRSMVA